MHEPLVREADIIQLARLEVEPFDVKEEPGVLVWLEYLPANLVVVDFAEYELFWRSLVPIRLEKVVCIQHRIATFRFVGLCRWR